MRFRYTPLAVEVLSLCPFRAGALTWQSAPNAWSLTVVVKATFTIVVGAEATLAPVQAPVTVFAGDSNVAIEDLSPLKPRVDVVALRSCNEDTATIEVSSCVVPARGPIPPYAPARRLLLHEAGLAWAAAVLRGEAATAGPAPEGFDFGFFHVTPREQRIDLVRPGSPLVLHGVLPGHARAETMLPQRKPQAFRIHPKTGKASEIILRCDTLCIDAALGVLILTFRGIADVGASDGVDAGTIVVAAHSAGKRLRADRIERFLRNGEPIEGESNDGRHPLEKRYDTVLAAPKGDTMALPELDAAASGGHAAAPANQSESSILRAPVGLPFQAPVPDAAVPAIPSASPQVPAGGQRLGTFAMPTIPRRGPDMPFQGKLPPPVEERDMPHPPPEGVFPSPPAMLPVAPEAEPRAPIEPPPMLARALVHDEKTADLPPGHAQPSESFEETTVDLPPKAAAAVFGIDATRPVAADPPKPERIAMGLATAPAAPVPAMTTPSAPKPIATLGAKTATPLSSAPKPAIVAAPKPAAPAAVTPKPTLPKGPLKVPAPLGPKLKTDVAAKAAPSTATAAEKKPTAVAPAKPVALAKPAPVVVRPAAPTKAAPLAATAAVAAAPKQVAAAPAASSKPDEPFDASAAMTIEQCAALEAELRHRSSTRKTLLEKNNLSDDQWAAVQKHWADAIVRETERGERKLLLAYDAAYVAVQEKLGVNVGLDTHARLQVAAERGATADMLKELGLEPPDQMRLGRVWTQRLADEPARMRQLAAAIEAARWG